MLVPAQTINAILQELLAEGKINIGNTVEIRRPSLWEYVNSISNGKQKEFLKQRLQGKTLSEIAEKNGEVTRERIRQIIKKCLDKKGVVINEDKYRHFYETYFFSKKNFTLAFGVDDSVYIYMTLVCEHTGNLPIKQIMENTDYPIELREGVERVIYKDYFDIGGVRVKKQRTDLADYVLRTYFQNEAVFDAFVEKYNAVLRDLDVFDDSQFLLSKATYQNRLAESKSVLWKYQNRFRYYDMASRDFSFLLKELNLEQYVDVEYSALKFFRSYPELMDEYDLRDEYELHNLLKKLYAKTNHSNIKFSRMPIIEFGMIDRKKQVVDLLMRLAPISVNDFCEAYEAEYGVLARTVAGSFISCIDEYRNNSGMYDISAEPLQESQKKIMQELLCDDYYDTSTVREIFCKEFPNANPNMINSYTLKSMGFMVYSSYVIKNSFANAKDYFNYILTVKDIVDISDFSSTLTAQLSFSSELSNLKSRYEIIELEPKRYINRRWLENSGITLDIIYDYCQKVSEFVQKEAYFTIYSLRQQGFAHPLDVLDFDDWFYAAVLKEDKKRYSYQQIGGTKVFNNSSAPVTKEKFFENILDQYSRIDALNFIKLLHDEYNLKLDKQKIAEIIDNSSFCYDRISQVIYKKPEALPTTSNSVIEERVKYIIASVFKNGFRMSSNIDFERFVKFYETEYGEKFRLEVDKLNAFVNSVAVVFDERAYVYAADIADAVRSKLEQLNMPCIDIGAFFDEYSGDFYSYGIFSKDMLKAFIEKSLADIVCRRDYVYLHNDISPTALVRTAFDEQEIWSLDELCSKLPWIKMDTIRQILNRDEYIRIEQGLFTHVETTNLPDEEGKRILASVNEAFQSTAYVIINDIDFSAFEKLNPHIPLLTVRDAVFKKFLANHYSKKGQVITRKDEKYSVIEIIEQYCKSVETVSFEELNSFEATFDAGGRTHSQCLIAAHNTMIRVSGELFVRENKVDFDVDKIDEVIELYCSGDFLPLKKIIDFSLFPYTGYQWNHFLLESYVRKYSNLFKYDVRAANSSNIGVIVRKSFTYNGYDDILAIALAKSANSLEDIKTIGDYLFENGYIGWRNLGGGEEKIVNNAKRIREGNIA
jgi:hypothetical protein